MGCAMDRRFWIGLPGLALLAGLLLVPAEAARRGEAEPDDRPGAEEPADDPGGEGPSEGKKPTGGDEERVITNLESEHDAWRLPPDWKNPDGSINQAALVAQQKRRVETMNQKLAARFQLVETKHYLIFSDADARRTGLFVKWCEALYASLGKQFRIDPGERVWDGKCILVICSTRSLFLNYARVFDGYNASRAGAYFAHPNVRPGYPHLVHIVIPLDSRDVRRLQELFAHEGTHAFFQLYKRPVDLPLWLHEGLAEFMTVVNDSSLRTKKQHFAKQAARQGRSLDYVFKSRSFGYPEYNISYTLVDFLVRAGRTKFKAFVEHLKEGQSQEQALQEAYGWSLIELETRWRVYVKEFLMRGR